MSSSSSLSFLFLGCCHSCCPWNSYCYCAGCYTCYCCDVCSGASSLRCGLVSRLPHGGQPLTEKPYRTSGRSPVWILIQVSLFCDRKDLTEHFCTLSPYAFLLRTPNLVGAPLDVHGLPARTSRGIPCEHRRPLRNHLFFFMRRKRIILTSCFCVCNPQEKTHIDNITYDVGKLGI